MVNSVNEISLSTTSSLCPVLLLEILKESTYNHKKGITSKSCYFLVKAPQLLVTRYWSHRHYIHVHRPPKTSSCSPY